MQLVTNELRHITTCLCARHTDQEPSFPKISTSKLERKNHRSASTLQGQNLPSAIDTDFHLSLLAQSIWGTDPDEALQATGIMYICAVLILNIMVQAPYCPKSQHSTQTLIRQAPFHSSHFSPEDVLAVSIEHPKHAKSPTLFERKLVTGSAPLILCACENCCGS